MCSMRNKVQVRKCEEDATGGLVKKTGNGCVDR